MTGALRYLSSSLGKKLLMALTGFFLTSFLGFHLVVNLFVFEGPKSDYTAYSEFLGKYPLVKPVELLLFAGFIVHFILGGVVWLMNRRARPKGYAVKGTSRTIKPSSRFTIFSAAVVFAFIVWHLVQFFFASRLATTQVDMYDLVMSTFKEPPTIILYMLALFVLGAHLRHGFQAMFQSTGLRTARYRGFIDALGVVVWLLVPLGFASIPLVIYFGGMK